MIDRKQDCPFCESSSSSVGYTNNNGSSIVYKTGEEVKYNWFGFLQPSTPSSLETGFNIQLMPLGHLESFDEIIGSAETPGDYELAQNLGIGLAKLSRAIQIIRKEEWKNERGLFVPAQILYGKCLTPENTQPHLHVKLLEFSGPVAQAFPTDAGWTKKTIYEPDATHPLRYVTADPTDKGRLPTERLGRLKSRLIEICNNI